MMDDKFHNRYRIPSARAQWHDYNGGSYFITICSRNMEHCFGEIVDGEMVLSEIGDFTQKSIKKIELLHDDVRVPVFQVMPNHIHMILVVNPMCDGARVVSLVETPYFGVSTFNGSTFSVPGSADFSAISSEMRAVANQCGRVSHVVARFKTVVTKYARQHNIDFGWQPRFHDHVIRNLKEWDLITRYIKNNVPNWHRDKFREKM